MKRKRALLALLLATVALQTAAQDAPLFDWLPGVRTKPAAAPRLDPKRIINESNSFLKEREPEMTGEEYALYERVTTMLTTNPAFALRMLESMMDETERPSPAFEFILGNVYYSTDQPGLAEKRYRSALERYPDFLRAWNNLGVLLYSHDRFAEAAPCFSKAVVLGDRDPMTFGLLGFCLERDGDIVSAEMAYLQAVSGDPGNADWKEGLLRIYIDGKQYGRAESLVRNLIKLRPAEKRLWLTYASVLVSQSRKIEAAVLLETCAGVGIAGPDELLLLGDLYAEQNLASEAVAIYKSVIASAADRGEQRLIKYAQVLIASGRFEEAGKTLDAIGADPTPQGRLALLQCRADLLIADGRWSEARAQAEALLKLAPLNGNALLTVGRACAAELDFARAMLAFEAAYQIPESKYPASIELAGLELRNHRYARSAEYLEVALGIKRSEAVEGYLTRVRILLDRNPNPG